MFYDGLHFGGMHLIWWFIWLSILVWIFALPYDIPGQRKRFRTPLEILRTRFASGEINTTEYKEKLALLEKDSTRQ